MFLSIKHSYTSTAQAINIFGSETEMKENFNHLLGGRKKIIVDDLQGFKRIGGGKDGEVYQLASDKCIKIFYDKATREKELKALMIGQSSSVIPRLFKYGTNYIVMEYINGTSLAKLLKKENKITKDLTNDILFVLSELNRIGFNRLDTEIRHILITKNKDMKVIDHKRAFSSHCYVPKKLLKGLHKYDLANDFLIYVKKNKPVTYHSWIQSGKN